MVERLFSSVEDEKFGLWLGNWIFDIRTADLLTTVVVWLPNSVAS